jgi:hypothetical protein
MNRLILKAIFSFVALGLFVLGSAFLVTANDELKEALSAHAQGGKQLCQKGARLAQEMNRDNAELSRLEQQLKEYCQPVRVGTERERWCENVYARYWALYAKIQQAKQSINAGKAPAVDQKQTATDLEAFRQAARQANPLAKELGVSDAKMKKNSEGIEAVKERINSLKPSDDFDINSSNILGKEIRRNQNQIAKLEKAIEQEKNRRLQDPNAIQELKNLKAALLEENKMLDWGKFDPDLARKWADKKLKSLEKLKRHLLEQNQALSSEIRRKEIQLTPHIQAMRDRCQSLANNHAVGEDDLAAKCGTFFSRNKSNLSYIQDVDKFDLDRFGVTPVVLPPSRFQGGFERGRWGDVPDPGPGHSVFSED